MCYVKMCTFGNFYLSVALLTRHCNTEIVVVWTIVFYWVMYVASLVVVGFCRRCILMLP